MNRCLLLFFLLTFVCHAVSFVDKDKSLLISSDFGYGIQLLKDDNGVINKIITTIGSSLVMSEVIEDQTVLTLLNEISYHGVIVDDTSEGKIPAHARMTLMKVSLSNKSDKVFITESWKRERLEGDFSVDQIQINAETINIESFESVSLDNNSKYFLPIYPVEGIVVQTLHGLGLVTNQNVFSSLNEFIYKNNPDHTISIEFKSGDQVKYASLKNTGMLKRLVGVFHGANGDEFLSLGIMAKQGRNLQVGMEDIAGSYNVSKIMGSAGLNHVNYTYELNSFSGFHDLESDLKKLWTWTLVDNKIFTKSYMLDDLPVLDYSVAQECESQILVCRISENRLFEIFEFSDNQLVMVRNIININSIDQISSNGAVLMVLNRM